MHAGDKAAEIAVKTVEASADRLIQNMGRTYIEAVEFLLDLYDLANEHIRQYAQTLSVLGSVGTTLTTLVISGSRYLVAHIGDSRCYLLDDAGIRRITQDHTMAQELIRQGGLAEQDYGSSPFRNQLTRSLGPRETCETDILPQLQFGELQGESTFLLCSDGFYSRLRDEDLTPIGSSPAALQQTLDTLAAEALRRQTSDNLSAIAVRYSPL
jgi:protein phosphatase